ncbi:hypothetical protein [Streptomyces caelestis]|uniref:hypothetical protein n=1 Tax=Streptomyces caelestis TaxID=36816 RepID=UPI0036F95505
MATNPLEPLEQKITRQDRHGAGFSRTRRQEATDFPPPRGTKPSHLVDCDSTPFGAFQYPTSPLAPVADLQLRSLLTDFQPADGPVSEGELTSVFARLARESEGIQDLDDKLVGR